MAKKYESPNSLYRIFVFSTYGQLLLCKALAPVNQGPLLFSPTKFPSNAQLFPNTDPNIKVHIPFSDPLPKIVRRQGKKITEPQITVS